jgi:hypothetical protein
LKSQIENSGYKLKYIAAEMGITYMSLLNKLNGKTDIKAKEISVFKKLLDLDPEMVSEIFFKDE